MSDPRTDEELLAAVDAEPEAFGSSTAATSGRCSDTRSAAAWSRTARGGASAWRRSS
jgi:hypothetical protein